MASKAGEPRVPMTLQKSRLKAEEKILDLDFELVNVQFNETGRYALRLTVENPLLEGSGAGVQLRLNEGNPVYTNTVTTDIIEQSNLNEIYAFEKRRFLFTLPKGFCKNDKNHDARLRIEALRFHSSLLKSSVKAGEAFFAIYPRTNQPRMNLFASRDEDLYGYSDIMALLRVGDDELAMHCGKLAYTVSFHEHRPTVPKRETPTTPRCLSPLPALKKEETYPVGPNSSMPFQSLGIPQPVYPGSTPEPSPQFLPSVESHTPVVRNFKQELSETAEPQYGASAEVMKDLSDEDLSLSLPSSSSSPIPRQLPSDASLHFPSPAYSPELNFADALLVLQKKSESSRPRKRKSFSLFSWGAKKVKEDPAEQGEPVLTSPTNDWHLANPEKESITVVLHGADNLPSSRKGHVPNPYVIVKTSSNEESKQPAHAVTHTALLPTHAPSWEEKVTVEIDTQTAGEEDVSLIIADKDTKEILARYDIPVKYLRPFHHYHCTLVLPRKKDPTGTKLHASIIRKSSLIPRYAGMNYTGLEVFLQGINEPLAHPMPPLFAIARIVNNVKAYMKEKKAQPPDADPVQKMIINFPDPKLEDFDVPRVNNTGYPQISSAGRPPEQPAWNMSFLFQGRDGATAFSDDTALVIEYYSSRHMPHPMMGRQSRKPPQESGSKGQTKPLGVSVLPLTNRVYRRLVAESSRNGVRVEKLPVQNTEMKTKSGETPTVQIGLQLISSERPDTFLTSSTTNVLPLLDPKLVGQLGNIKEPWTPSKTSIREETSYIEPERKRANHELPVIQQNDFPSHDAIAEILPENRAIRPIIQEVPDHQEQEVENYRSAMQKMADDILSLRRHVANLESENSTLRRNLAMHEDVGRTLLEDMDLDVMTKAEIVDRILALKHKLSSGARDMVRMKDRVQRLQNELIRKNDREKDLMMLQRAHQQQQMALRKYQAKIGKMKALEDAVRQQEKVIERMERMLEEKMKERFKDGILFSEAASGTNFVGDTWSKDLYSTLMMENMRLRDELGKSSYRSAPIILQQQALPDSFSANTEKLSLISKLEKAEARIRVLEGQLEESARRWGREKQEYSNHLLEYDRGFGHSPASLIIQDFLREEKEKEGRRDEDEMNRKRGAPESPA